MSRKNGHQAAAKTNGKLTASRSKKIEIEKVVRDRYAQGANSVQTELCCPVSYNPEFLKIIPKEILDKDYGCGDPSAFLKEGDVVLDLGSGGGKICYIASQIVGRSGKVIGVDFNPTMLKLAKKYQKQIAKKIGWSNVEFKWGKIQDLKQDLAYVEKKLAKSPIRGANKLVEFQSKLSSYFETSPLIANDSVDVIVSNCVLNLVRAEEKRQLFTEMFRVLKKGGRVAISDIVSDEIVPEHLRNDPELWSGCVSGAFEEKEFLKAFEDAGFYGVQINKRDEKPWKTVEGIEFRSVTVTAWKGKEGLCWERNQAVVYKGPWKRVCDDDNHVLHRGVRTAVCDKTFQIYSKEPYVQDMILISPKKNIPLSKAKPFDCKGMVERHPRETKGQNYKATSAVSEVCVEGECC